MSTPGGIRLWRLVKAGRADSAWDGEGAFRFGGRWNSRGVRAVYASSSLALALLEVLVHLDPALPLPAMCAIPALVPADAVEQLASDDAPRREPSEIRFPYALQSSRETGDEWIRSNAGAVLAVPSAIVPTEFNYLLNPAHPGFREIEIGPPRMFAMDSRLRGQ